MLILKYYLYECRWLDDESCINGCLKNPKYCIQIEKTTINFLSSTQKDYACKNGLPYECVLGV